MNKKYNKSTLLLSGLAIMLGGCSALEPVNRPDYRQPPSRTAAPPEPLEQSSRPAVTTTPYHDDKSSTVPASAPAEPEIAKNPYEDVPQMAGERPRPVGGVSGGTTNMAVTSAATAGLIAQASAEISAGKYSNASSKLERALRIEPRNPQIWYLLATSSFDQKQYASAVSMAKKSNLYAASGSALERKNWQLIKEAAKKSGDIATLKQAILYERANP